MSNNAHFGRGFAVSPVRRVPMPKFEFALEKFLQDRRRRPKEDDNAVRLATPAGGRIPSADRSSGRF